jgi:hypothetical protein
VTTPTPDKALEFIIRLAAGQDYFDLLNLMDINDDDIAMLAAAGELNADIAAAATRLIDRYREMNDLSGELHGARIGLNRALVAALRKET